MLSNNPFIISEVGINHNGSLEIAKKLIDMAKSAGCDAVKFQKRDIETVYTQEFLDSKRISPWGTTQRQQKTGLELDEFEYDTIDSYCKDLKIPWFASAWDEKSLEFLRKYDLPYNKIASAMITNRGFIEKVALEGKMTFISTGMSNFSDIDYAVDLFRSYKTPFVLMHSVSLYPCPDEYCNLELIRILKRRHECLIGYSGHEMGILPSVLAVCLGAIAIERHITLDRGMYGSDQSASLEKRGLELLVRDCRDVKKMIGTGYEKLTMPGEAEVAYKLRYWKE